MLQCSVCYRPANSFNYGVFSCDACKMFFRRAALHNLPLKCKRSGKCFEILPTPISQRCRACRLEKCFKAGMSLKVSTILEVKNKKDDEMANLIGVLLYHNSARERSYLTCFTDDDPSLKELVSNRSNMLVGRNPNNAMKISDWVFCSALTSCQFLLNLNFMTNFLEDNDKLILLNSFYTKASIIFTCFRSYQSRSSAPLTPDGRVIYPDEIRQLPTVSHAFLCNLRYKLIARFVDLNVTKEELLLLTVILFCDSAHPLLSEHAVKVVSTQQKIFNSALFQYCKVIYQNSAPSRLTDLLSLCHIINKNQEEVEYLRIMFQIYTPDYKTRKLVRNAQ